MGRVPAEATPDVAAAIMTETCPVFLSKKEKVEVSLAPRSPSGNCHGRLVDAMEGFLIDKPVSGSLCRFELDRDWINHYPFTVNAPQKLELLLRRMIVH